ncbi:MAG TPA: hypothetical protein PLW35_05330 [Verrucomicrobiota bacterium]|mgnify:CR=1 FL=1|nr:hypothetical protein [Verrucomicrobiota bacterium]HOK77129.1 hypothetical protein [Verrucomicrobiota bacterium]
MNALFRYKTLIYLCAVFLTGVIAGGAVGYGLAHKTFFRPPTKNEMARHILSDLTKELQLTQEQVAQVTPLIENAAKRIHEANQRAFNEVKEVIQSTDKELSKFLTAEQKKLLEEMHKRRDRNRPGGPPPGPPGEGPPHGPPGGMPGPFPPGPRGGGPQGGGSPPGEPR